MDECVVEVTKCLDEVYTEIIEDISNFNKEMIKRTDEFLSLKTTIIKMVDNKESVDDILEVIEQIKEEDLIADKIKLRNTIMEDISISLPRSAKYIAKVIEDSKSKLKNFSDCKYLINMLQKKLYDNVKEYNELTVSGLLNDNPYLTAYIETRNDLISYIEQVMDEYVEVEIKDLENKEIKELKFKQRLRVTYDELQKFAKHMGYEEVRQGNTTHKVWKNPKTGLSNPIPNKSGTVPQGTVSRILKQMELTRADLAKFLYN